MFGIIIIIIHNIEYGFGIRGEKPILFEIKIGRRKKHFSFVDLGNVELCIWMEWIGFGLERSM